MKRALILGSALAVTSAMAGGEEEMNTTNRQLDKGGKPKASLPFAKIDRLVLNSSRDLRSRGERGGKQGKAEPPQDGGGGGDHDMPHSKSGKAKGNKGGSGTPGTKSGKSSNGDHGDDIRYYMAPFKCAKSCIDADGADFRTGQLNTAVKRCSAHEMHGETQQWILHTNNDFIQVESYEYKGKCIAVDYKPGDTTKAIKDKCDGGTLALLPCQDPASHWYFTGGQLLSFFCWTEGVSAAMGVPYEEDKEKCHDELISSTSMTQMSRGMSVASTFMFIDSEDMMLYDFGVDSGMPTFLPTMNPTIDGTFDPTLSPTMSPTLSPTLSPTYIPTAAPISTAA